MKYLSAIGNGCVKVLKAAKKLWDECTEAENYAAARRVDEYQAQQYQLIIASLQGDYQCVANTVRNCLDSVCKTCGLNCPKRIEDVLCEKENETDKNISIDLDKNKSVIFRFESDRVSSDLLMGGGRRVERPQVKAGEIEDKLKRALPNHTNPNGYYFSGLTVIDIPKNRVRIELRGVYKKEICI